MPARSDRSGESQVHHPALHKRAVIKSCVARGRVVTGGQLKLRELKKPQNLPRISKSRPPRTAAERWVPPAHPCATSTEPQNHPGWNRPPGSPSPTASPTPPRPEGPHLPFFCTQAPLRAAPPAGLVWGGGVSAQGGMRTLSRRSSAREAPARLLPPRPPGSAHRRGRRN